MTSTDGKEAIHGAAYTPVDATNARDGLWRVLRRSPAPYRQHERIRPFGSSQRYCVKRQSFALYGRETRWPLPLSSGRKDPISIQYSPKSGAWNSRERFG